MKFFISLLSLSLLLSFTGIETAKAVPASLNTNLGENTTVSFEPTKAVTVTGGTVFEVVNPDLQTSPYTGMTKQHWRDAAMHLLTGAFSYVNTIDDPMDFPKQEGVSYPREESQIKTARLEALSRTLFIAAPLLKENPDLEINNINVAEYYRHHIINLSNPQSPSYIGYRMRTVGPSQTLVELGAIAISLFMAPEVLWDPIPFDRQEDIAGMILSFGEGPTIESNWRFFNIFIMSFFKDQDQFVYDELLEEYIELTLADYAGEGWYNDNPAYDFYSMWGYQMYGIFWADSFGDRHYPEYAAQFRANFEDMKNNYPYLFGRDGETVMWGRSISYRIASIAPIALTGLTVDESVNYGWMRRIASGTLKQFLTHPDFMMDNVPTLGFYGPFEPAVQSYSCRASSYWMGKAFAALLLPDDNPFWTAIENEGPWADEFELEEVYNKFQPESEILITNYPGIGASEVRAWCHVEVIPAWEKFRGSENYNRLAYNTAFPWQADGLNGEVAMNYVFKNSKSEWEPFRLYTFKKFENGVYYRDAELETDRNVKAGLADITLPNGILRVDRHNGTTPVEMRLGHYALPALSGDITETTRTVGNYSATIIDNGKYQLAMVPLSGWTNTEVVEAEGLHPESNLSKVINVTGSYRSGSGSGSIYAVLMLWKPSGEQWSDSELLPVTSVEVETDGNSVTVTKASGEKLTVDY